jgi:hypothetical protein
LGKALTAIDSFFGKSNGGCSQPHILPLSGKELEGPSSNGGGVRGSCNFGGNCHAPIVGGHHPSFAEVVREAGKPFVLLGKGKELRDFELMGKAQYASEAGFADRGLYLSLFRVVEGSARGSDFASFPYGASDSVEAAYGEKSDKLGLNWVWKVKLEQLKGEVEWALLCVYEGLDMFGLSSKDWVFLSLSLSLSLKATILKPKPKPNSKRLGLVMKHGEPKIQSSKVETFCLDEGCRAPSLPILVSDLSEVVLIPVALPEVVILLASTFEDV